MMIRNRIPQNKPMHNCTARNQRTIEVDFFNLLECWCTYNKSGKPVYNESYNWAGINHCRKQKCTGSTNPWWFWLTNFEPQFSLPSTVQQSQRPPPLPAPRKQKSPKAFQYPVNLLFLLYDDLEKIYSSHCDESFCAEGTNTHWITRSHLPQGKIDLFSYLRSVKH